jgi:hypothetical protein
MAVNAIKFPNMINEVGNSQVIFEKEATYQNLKYLLLSTKKTLLGDPYFGVNLRNMIYEKNNVVLRDLIIDDVFTNISIYMPQLRIERKNIEVVSTRNLIEVTIRA